MPDILDEIVARRKDDYARLGAEFGSAIPAHRARPVIPFMAKPGTILEIKRASPSKGDIAPDLDAAQTALAYERAGTTNVSVLTEMNFFKGSLDDLVAASAACPGMAFLRKDFILYDDEIEVSYRAGADAVLLIARILDRDTLIRLAAKVRSFGMTPFIEVRETDDVAKLDAARKAGTTVAGVNARDLATFKIDPLVPATMRAKLQCKTVFESGASTPGACRFARQLGFDGILVGEAVARNPEAAGTLVSAFLNARPDWIGQFWREIGKKIATRAATGKGNARRPLVKVCGITNAEDALLAASLGADMLGFIFAPSPRAAGEAAVREIAAKLDEGARSGSLPGGARPLLVGVIVDPEGDEAKAALALAAGGILDAIQYHGENDATDLPKIDAAGGDFGIGRYAVVRMGSEADLARIDELAKNGEPRILVDARVDGIAGGTGKTIPKSLVRRVSEKHGLWLAGGINPSNVRQYIDEFSPELIDASSGLESAPGKKDHVLVKSFFREIAG